MFKPSRIRDVTRILQIAFIGTASYLFLIVDASLFDSLPLNGALLPSESDGRIFQNLVPDNLTETTSPPATSLKSVSGEKSLFDMLPHQGAIVPSKLKSPKPTGVTYSVTNSRNHRQSASSKTSKRSFNDFEIERQPTTDLDISFFNSHLLPSVVQTLTQPQPPRSQIFPIISEVNRQSSGYGPPPNQNNKPQIVPEPVVFREVKLTNAVRNSQSSYALPLPTGASATSGGSTVIVYANPPPEKASGNDRYKSQGYATAPPPRTSYGIPTERSTSAPPKNEVHYHYHITNNNRIESTTAPSTQYGPPSTEYGAPRTTFPPPPPTYGPPPTSSKPKKISYNRGGYGEYSTGGRYEESGSNMLGSYQPPTNNNRGGYQESTNKNRNDYQEFKNTNRGSYQASSDASRNGYDGSSYTQRTPSTTPSVRELIVPVITGVSLAGSTNPGGYQDQTSQSSRVSEFTSRKLYTSLQAPSDQSSYQYSNNPIPSPSASYGPPPTYSDAYTTTTSPPPQEPFNNPPQHIAQTSITLETIPITTTETRFVTVPKIVQTLGTTLQQPPEQLNNPPAISPQYGPPLSQQNIRNPTSQPTNARNILDEHLAQLSPQSQTQGSSADLSDLDLLALIQQSSRSRNQLDPQQQSDIRAFAPLTLNSNSPVFTFSDLRQSPQSISFNALPFSQSHSQSQGVNSGLGGARGSNTALGTDNVGALSDLIREQRLQLSLTDLRSRLRQQTRNNDRNRQSLRDLFFKGALLMAGLTLIPSATTIGSAPGPQITSSLVPLTAGRRRRSLSPQQELFVDIPKPLESTPNRNPVAHPTPVQFPKSLDQLNAVSPITLQFSATPDKAPEHAKANNSSSLPCMQRQFCDTLQTMEKNKQISMIFLYAALSPDLDKNKFLRDAIEAAGRADCSAFPCDKLT